MPSKGRTQIWSCGGGVQSTAIAALIIRGHLPTPDLAVIADTERELSTTWEYLEKYTAPPFRELTVKGAAWADVFAKIEDSRRIKSWSWAESK